MNKQSSFPTSSKDSHRINEDIDAAEVRLVDASGENRGLVPFEKALNEAIDAGLDLVEVGGESKPPVCKIMDFGKYKFSIQKKRNAARKKQKTVDVKEIKLRPSIDAHDFDVKMKAAVKFLDNGDKVKITLRFRGREMARQEIGMQLLEKIKLALQDISKVEQEPNLEGRQIIMILVPS